ncbi:MAG: DUF1501 domain-containing protein [Pirellulales bacterium]
MLSISEGAGRYSRREWLRIGGLGLGAFTASNVFSESAFANLDRSVYRDRSVVFLFMAGGPSQIETFDPKMTAPAEIRSTTGEIPTKLSGITFGSTFPKLAAMADRMTVVRSFTTGDGNHDIKPVVSKETQKASLGAIYSRVAGSMNAERGIPSSVVLYPNSVDISKKNPPTGFGNFADPGTLGTANAPFVPGSGPMSENMTMRLSPSHFENRRSLLSQLDRLRRDVDAKGDLTGMDKFQSQAHSTILSQVGAAFDLSKESAESVARYDTAPLLTPNQISRTWNNYEQYVTHGQTLGKLMLLARRLVEAGSRFITINTAFVWDNHSDVNNAGVEEGMQYCGVPFDHAVSTFLADLRERGLSEKVLLVCCGEMGRVPRLNGRGGRDHWGSLAPLLLAGGGYERGQVVGSSTRDAGEPATERITQNDLITTIAGHVFNLPQLRLRPDVPPELMRILTTGNPIPGQKV